MRKMSRLTIKELRQRHEEYKADRIERLSALQKKLSFAMFEPLGVCKLSYALKEVNDELLALLKHEQNVSEWYEN
jgi:hypothetical protein